MLFSLYVILEIIAVGFFAASFFTKQEILWAVTLLSSALLMFSSFGVEYYVYQWNTTIQAYSPVMVTFSYPYMMGFNTLFFVLSLALGLFDLFEKYGTKITENEDHA
jgi:hypothetical protein